MVEAEFQDLVGERLDPRQRASLIALLDGAVGPEDLRATIDAAVGGA
jgi:hypothetical protein